MKDESPTPAILFASLAGAMLVVFGVIGFFYEGSFATGAPGITFKKEFGLFAVNGWHNALHVLLGLLGLVMAVTTRSARAYCLGVGAILIGIAIWGFFEAPKAYPSLLDTVPINNEANFLHLILGTIGIGAGMATPKIIDVS